MEAAAFTSLFSDTDQCIQLANQAFLQKKITCHLILLFCFSFQETRVSVHDYLEMPGGLEAQ